MTSKNILRKSGASFKREQNRASPLKSKAFRDIRGQNSPTQIREEPLVSAIIAVYMAMLLPDAYEKPKYHSPRSEANELVEGAILFTSIFLFYFLFIGCTLVWIATRGNRFPREEAAKKKAAANYDDEYQ